MLLISEGMQKSMEKKAETGSQGWSRYFPTFQMRNLVLFALDTCMCCGRECAACEY